MPQNHVIPVRLATTGPISILHGPPLIDGVAPAPGDRILVKQQVNPIENGIYLWHGVGVPMTHALDSPLNPAGVFFSPRFPESGGKPHGQA